MGAKSSPFKVLLSLRKVVRCRNFLRLWLPRRLSLVGADNQMRRVSQNPNTREPKKKFLVWGTWNLAFAGATFSPSLANSTASTYVPLYVARR